MKVVILAGGYGTRLSEYTDVVPKPMVRIGDKPILWHIMERYAHYGHKEFIVALGYKADVIKEFFLHYNALTSDFTVGLSDGGIRLLSSAAPDWSVTLVDTGIDTMTGGRVRRLKEIIGDEPFLLTYGDGVADIDIAKLVDFHRGHGRLITLSAVRPAARFGELKLDGSRVDSFEEKPQLHEGWINGGFFVVEPKFVDYIDSDATMLEREPLERATRENEVMAYRHDGFWHCMDSKRDKDVLEKMCLSDNPPWLKY